MAVEEIVIVGGGIAGVATAVALRRVGKTSLVLERWQELRETGSAVTLARNGWLALDALGVGHKLKSHYRLIRTGTVTNLATGATQTQSFANKDDDANGEEMGSRSVHRTALLEALAEELPPDSIRFSSKLVSIKTEVLPDSSTVLVLHLEDGAIIKAKAVIGCDGVHSVVAQWLGLAAPRDSGRSAVRGLAVYPEGHDFGLGVQQFLFNGIRAGFVPINDKDVYWFVTHPTTPKVHEMGRDPESIRRATLEHLLIDFPAEFKSLAHQSDPSSLSCAQLLFRLPWHVFFGQVQRGCVTVAGDAFHPTTPDLGQGACIALEDTVVLARCLAGANSPKDMEEGMAKYAAQRRWRATWLIIASYCSGFVQQASDGPWSRGVKLFRDLFFYRFVFPWIARIWLYDCGKLPEV